MEFSSSNCRFSSRDVTWKKAPLHTLTKNTQPSKGWGSDLQRNCLYCLLCKRTAFPSSIKSEQVCSPCHSIWGNSIPPAHRITGSKCLYLCYISGSCVAQASESTQESIWMIEINQAQEEKANDWPCWEFFSFSLLTVWIKVTQLSLSFLNWNSPHRRAYFITRLCKGCSFLWIVIILEWI